MTGAYHTSVHTTLIAAAVFNTFTRIPRRFKFIFLELKFNSYLLRCNQALAVAIYLVRCMPAVHAFLSRLRGRLQCTRVLSSPAPAVFFWFVFGVDLHLHLRTWHLECPLRSSLAYLSALHDARTWLLVSHRGGRSPLTPLFCTCTFALF